MSKVVELDVSNNDITDFKIKEIFHSLPQLRHINVSNNKITELRAHMLEGMACRTVLNLSNNPIQTTSKNILSVIRKLADKDITIQLYNTQLPQDMLQKMSSSLSSVSRIHRCSRMSLWHWGYFYL